MGELAQSLINVDRKLAKECNRWIDASDILKLAKRAKTREKTNYKYNEAKLVDVKFNYIKGFFYEVTSWSVNNEATSKRWTENTLGSRQKSLLAKINP